MDTLESLQRKMNSAGDLESVVKTMKAMAASNIKQYDMAGAALGDYYKTVKLGIAAYFKQENSKAILFPPVKTKEKIVGAIVFGSDQGLVGQFNDVLSNFAVAFLRANSKKIEVWSVGERVRDRLLDAGFLSSNLYSVPNSVSGITALVGQILVDVDSGREERNINEFYIFHNCPNQGAGYVPVSQRLLPLDQQWKQNLETIQWPTDKLPEVVGEMDRTLFALINSYLFVSLYKASSESLASENASRLEAMQRAEKNIDELLEALNANYHRLRQGTIDEELFDVVAGFEAMKKEKK